MRITKAGLKGMIFEVLNEIEYDVEDDGPEAFPFRIFCDMDGVLVDLAGGILAAAKQDAANPKQRAAVMKIIGSDDVWSSHQGNKKMETGLKFMYELLNDNEDFWATLPAMKDAMKLWSFISNFDPFILSHPWDEESASGKRIWLAGGSINPSPDSTKVILTGDKHKHAVNKATGAPNILIDDMERYVGPWKSAGGIAIHHVSAESSIKELKAIMENHKNGQKL